MQRTAAIFPGQGSQLVGMGADLAAASRKADEVFSRANDLLGFDLRSSCFEGPAEQLERTDVQQPAILVTSIACLEALSEHADVQSIVGAAGGLSLGEYTALYFGGSLSFDDAVTLVRRRGELMQEAATANRSGMVSLIGADEQTASELCEKAAQGDVLVPANFNCPGQVVISGSIDACRRAVDMCDEFACRAMPLKVAGAFHSPFMEPAAVQLGEVLASVEIKPPRIPVLSNVTADFHTEPDEIRRLLRDQVTHPVRWQACVEKLLAEGYDCFSEIGPGRVLTGMMRKIDRNARALSIGTMDAVRKDELLAPT